METESAGADRPPRRLLPAAAALWTLLLALATKEVAAADVPSAHMFQKDQCVHCHLFPTRPGTFLRDRAFRRDVTALCVPCHEREGTGTGHRVGMVPTMPVPPDFHLDLDGRLTCATCHDPHAVESRYPHLLRRPAGPSFCALCHPDGLPARAPPTIIVSFPPDRAVVASRETVVAGTVTDPALRIIEVRTGRESHPVAVKGGSFAARVRLEPGRNEVTISYRRAPLIIAQGSDQSWRPHLTSGTGQCAVCHDGRTPAPFPGPPVGAACYRCHQRLDRMPHTHRPVASGDCTACHDPHGAGTPPAGARSGALCLRCHEVGAARRHALARSGARGSGASCLRCHDPHQSTQPALTTSAQASLALSVELEAPQPRAPAAAAPDAPPELPGFGLIEEPGRPRLPERIVTLAVPPGADPASARFRIVEAETTALEGVWTVPPAPPLSSWVGGRTLVEWGRVARPTGRRDREAYGTDALWPRRAVSLVRDAALGETALVRIAYRPLQYNPRRRTLTFTRRAVAEIVFSPARTAPRPSGGKARKAAPRAADLGLVNARRAAAWSEPVGEAVIAAGGADYAIVTTRAIAAASAALQAFVDHKGALGMAARIVTEDDYGATPPGQRRALAIRQWLRGNREALGLRFALLVGDPHPESGDVPMLRAWPRRGALTNATYADAPTDLFFADLTGDWDLSANGYYGEYRGDRGAGGVDFVPELFVGRIPVYGGDVAALDAVLRKTMAYEREAGPSPWRRSALLPMSFVDAATDGAHLAEQMKSEFLLGRGFSPWTLYQQGSSVGADSAFTSDAELRGGAVLERWRSFPYGVVAWWGHGSPARTLVGYTGAWDGELLAAPADGLSETAPAFVFQVACLNGYPETAGNLGYALLRRGAVATVASSRVSWYGVGLQDFRRSASNAGIGYRYLERLTAGQPAGEALALAKGDPALAAASDTLWMNLMEFNLYGDPAVGLFRGPVLSPSPGVLELVAAEGEREPLAGGVVLAAGDAAVAVQASTETSWLTVQPGAASTPVTLSLLASPAGLVPGTRAARILVTSPEAANAPISVPVSLRVTRAGRIGGRVLSAGGRVVPGATVSLRGPRERSVTTDIAGAYEFSPLPPGAYTVSASASGLLVSPAGPTHVLGEGESRTTDFTARGLEIRGRVTDAAGAPLRGVAVRVSDPSGVLLRRVYTGRSGAYLVRNLAPGTYLLRARLRPWRFAPSPLPVTLEDAAVSDGDFRGRR